MAARTLGWAQRVSNGPAAAFGLALNASTDTAVNPTTASTTLIASDRAAGVVEVTAGVSISVRWGGQSSTLYGAAATNTQTWLLNCFYDVGTNLWETAATDTLVVTTGTVTCDRTLTFTPTHSGTVRLVVKYTAVVTTGGALVATLNTDGGNTWGAGTETLPATGASVGFTPGLVRAGTTLTAFAQSGGNGSGVYATYAKTIVNTLTTGHAPRSSEAAQTYTISWQNGGTPFGSTSVAAGTTTTPSATGLAVDNVWPITAFNTTLKLTPANSTLSAANGGTGLPWVHYTTAPSTPGTVTTTTDAAGKITAVTFTAAFSADNRLTHQFYMQLNTTTVGTPPDGVTDLSHNVPDKTAADVGEVTHRVKDANGAGVNGIGYTAGTVTLTDANSLVSPVVRPGNTLTTATLGGATGWLVGTGGLGGADPNFAGWASVLPAGAWRYNYAIASPAAAVGLETPASPIATAIQAQNPHVHVAAFLNGTSAAPGGLRHVKPGDTLRLVATATSEIDGKRVTPDSGTVWLTHFNVAANQLEHLVDDTDNTTAAWQAWPSSTARHVFALAGGTDPTQMAFTFSNTAGWGNYPVVVRVTLVVAGVDYPIFFARELPAAFNPHDVADAVPEVPDFDSFGGTLI